CPWRSSGDARRAGRVPSARRPASQRSPVLRGVSARHAEKGSPRAIWGRRPVGAPQGLAPHWDRARSVSGSHEEDPVRLKAMMIGLGSAAAVALGGCWAGYYDGYYTSGYGYGVYGGRDYYSYPSQRYGYAYPRRGYPYGYRYREPYAYRPPARVVP